MSLKVSDYTKELQHALVVELHHHINGIKDRLDEKVMSMYKEGRPDPYWQQLTRYSILFVGTLSQVAEFKAWMINSKETAGVAKTYTNET